LILEQEDLTVVIAKDSEVLAASSTGQIWYSSDQGADWIDISFGLPTQPIRDMAFGSDSVLMCTIGSSIYRKQLNGPWSLVYQYPGPNFHCIKAKGDSVAIGSTESGKVHLSTDNGLQWSILVNSPSYVTDIEWWQGSLVVASWSEGVKHSTDLGQTWSDLGVSVWDNAYCLASTTDRLLSGMFGPVQAFNGSGAWTNVLNPNVEVNNMEAEGQFVLAQWRYVSLDQGQTWQILTPPGNSTFTRPDVSGGVGYAITPDRLWKIDLDLLTSVQEEPSGPSELRYAHSDHSLFYSGPHDRTIQVIDMMGRVCSTHRVTVHQERIDLSFLTPGIYIARDDRDSFTLKFVR
jgi:hypothetical protein